MNQFEGLESCRLLTSPTLLYPKAEKLKSVVKEIISQSKWAGETERLTTSMLNYLGEVTPGEPLYFGPVLTPVIFRRYRKWLQTSEWDSNEFNCSLYATIQRTR